MTELGKQVWKKMEEMGWENAPKDFQLEYYENIIECTKQALTITNVVGQSELLKDFVNKWNTDNDIADNPIIYDGFIDEFLKSL